MENTSPKPAIRENASGAFRQVRASVRTVGSLVRYAASHQAMGTIFSVVAYGASSAFLGEVVRRAFQEIDHLNDEMSHYKPESELSAINHEAFRQRVVVTPGLFKLLEDSLRYGDETFGAFDITIGPLMKSWGFFRGWGRLPSPPELTEVLKRIGYRYVKLDAVRRTVSFDKPGIELDLGAIGKGYAVDRATEILRAEGITQALISSGTSSIYALGSPPGEEGWEVSVCHPLDRRKTACTLRLQNLSISVSGDYEKFFELGGRIYAHIIDPNTGMPAEDMVMTVVISPSAAESDALSTSFFVGGVKRSQVYLEYHPDLTAIFYTPMRFTHTIEQIVLKSTVTKLPADRFARI
jgi:thiamine biosynthesis lipoprotein